MSTFKCKMCGGTIEFDLGETVGVCDSCGTKQTLPRLDDDKKANLYDRANHFRRNNDFDKAMGIYEQILNEDKTDAESYWSLVLCRYGIEYVEDPTTHKRVPTVNRAQFTSIFADEDYKSAIQYADGYQKAIYEEEAKAIDEIQKGILAISQKEEPFDVFICYKDTDANGRRTQDSVLANELYHELTNEGFKVFFSRITLEDKLGTAYEPYIFAALNSAKVMVVLGTKPEHFNAVWVKNEWSRYLALIKNGAKKMLIPAYRDMDPYDLPEEFSHLQAQDMSKLGFMQDLIRGIKKIIDADAPKAAVKETVVVNASGASTAPLLERVFLFLEDGKWQDANIYCEKVLDIDPKNAMAYLGKLMAELQVRNRKQLADCAEPFNDSDNYSKVLRFGDESLEAELRGYIAQINDRNENARLTALYNEAVQAMQSADTEQSFLSAAEQFESIEAFSDAAVKAEECRKKAEKCRAEEKAEAERHIAELAKVRARIHPAAGLIAVGVNHTVGLKADGTVIATKYTGDPKNYSGQCEVSDWRDIVAVAAGQYHTVGLKSDGTVVATKYTGDPVYYSGQCEVSGWHDIVAIAADNFHTVGLKSDGTAVTTEDGEFEDGDWRDILAIAAGGYRAAGLKADGTVVTNSEHDVDDWRDIVAIATEGCPTVGLKADGRVVIVGDNSLGWYKAGDWRDIVAIATGDIGTMGLKADGTVVTTEDDVAVSGWRDIVAIAAGFSHTVGLKSDGTVVAVGLGYDGRCEVSDWKLFNSIDTLKEERAAAMKAAEERRIANIAALNSERSSLSTELANLHGLFTGKRRKEIEARLAEIDAELTSIK